ncbi:GNAT family N-acetyltransferase [Acidimicrobiaceae bacterium USS-CC1]|uniref:GNAT family N-acetyltransferase n=1 Tax=Acidiferrimicrobium australe TaxID=2664430 RepID=A0ABW9QQI9_9ACTN|nr:GNAT family N-acetyltransferase [Acidiferrimicrobium australe]
MRRSVAGGEIDDDPGRVDVEAVWRYLSEEAYWERWRDRGVVERQVRGAWRVVGAYDGATGRQVGFARAVSDGESFAYLADVWVAADWRGNGLGGAIVSVMIDEGPGARFRWVLHTRDARGLYVRYGFAAATERVLERPGRG